MDKVFYVYIKESYKIIDVIKSKKELVKKYGNQNTVGISSIPAFVHF